MDSHCQSILKWKCKHALNHSFKSLDLKVQLQYHVHKMSNTWIYWREFLLLLMLPFFVFPLCTHTHLVRDLFFVLHHLSGTICLVKLGNTNTVNIHSHLSDQLWNFTSFSYPTVCACTCAILFWQCLVLCFVMDYMLLFQEIALKENNAVVVIIIITVTVQERVTNLERGRELKILSQVKKL